MTNGVQRMRRKRIRKMRWQTLDPKFCLDESYSIVALAERVSRDFSVHNTICIYVEVVFLLAWVVPVDVLSLSVSLFFFFLSSLLLWMFDIHTLRISFLLYLHAGSLLYQCLPLFTRSSASQTYRSRSRAARATRRFTEVWRWIRKCYYKRRWMHLSTLQACWSRSRIHTFRCSHWYRSTEMDIRFVTVNVNISIYIYICVCTTPERFRS